MKRLLVLLACCSAVAMSFVAVSAFAQDDGDLPVINYVYPSPVDNSNFGNLSSCLGSAVVSVPMDCFTFLSSKYGNNKTDIIVGRSPFSRGKAVTTVKIKIVPLIVTIGTTVFDPTLVNACSAPNTLSDVAQFQGSPILQPVAWDGAGGAGHGALMNGVNTGTTTYNDANRRAEFWSLVGGSNYQTAFSVTTSAPMVISAATVATIGGGIVNGSNACNTLGILYLNPAGPGGDFDAYVQNTLIPALGIPADTFPVFLMHNIVWSLASPPTISNCCVLGYHGTFITGSSVWTYSPTDYDTSNRFGGGASVHDTAIAAHEIGEWLDDPLGNNPTPAPAWGKIGQVGGCQGNWEVGDPLSGTNFPSVAMPNGYTYKLQELAFWAWFYNGYTLPTGPSAPSLAAGGKFSTNGTFAGASQPCTTGAGGTYPN